MSMLVKTVFSESMLLHGVREYIKVDLDKVPHWAISGVTGMGKTYCTKLILARIARTLPDSQFFVCDFKGEEDFSFLSDTERFYRFDQCKKGLEDFYAAFQEVQRTGQKPEYHTFFVFDEWGAFITSLDKKEAEAAKQKLSYLLMLGRSFRFHVVLSQQRLNAEDFGKTRDQLNCLIFLGNPSKEVIGMLFLDYKDEILPDRKRGTGYMLLNGSEFHKIVVPTISDMGRVNNQIRLAVEH